ncbi:MAG TPA: uroporphyrinogen-III synthase [Usitatibacter sp.]|nr:uroporphyrinogen-III synthase [Usitatibacter sp.]
MSASRDLEGLGVVVTRPIEAARILARSLEARGARVFLFPALAIEDLPATPELAAALDALPHAAIAIFVSAHAVEKGLAAARARGPWPEGVEVAGVGDATAKALRNSGFARVISPAGRHDSEGLLETPRLQAVRGENIIVFRGEGGREHLREALEARGATVRYAQCYRRVRPDMDPAPLLAAFDRGEVHAVSALSGETLENFVTMMGTEGERRLKAAALVVPHPAVGSHRAASRFARIMVSEPGPEGLGRALSQLRVPT